MAAAAPPPAAQPSLITSHRPYPAVIQPPGHSYQHQRPSVPYPRAASHVSAPSNAASVSSSPWAALFSQRVGFPPGSHSTAPPLVAPSSFAAQHSTSFAAGGYPRQSPAAPHIDRQRHIQQQQQHTQPGALQQQHHNHHNHHTQHNQQYRRNNSRSNRPNPSQQPHIPTTSPTHSTTTPPQQHGNSSSHADNSTASQPHSQPHQHQQHQPVKKRKKTFDEVDDIIAHYSDKIGGDEPDDVQKWKEERRKAFPTRDNVRRKGEEQKERVERGEIGESEGSGEVDRLGRGRGGRGGKRGRGGGGRDGGDGGRGRERGQGSGGRGRGGRGGWKGGWDSEQQKGAQMEDDVHDVERKEDTAAISQSTAPRAVEERKQEQTDIPTTAFANNTMPAASSTAAAASSSSPVASDAVSAPSSSSLPSSSPSTSAPADDDDDDSPPVSLPLTPAPAELERMRQQHQADDARRQAQQLQRHQQRESLEAEREWRQQRVNVCRYYVNNECKRGDECEWPHDEEARREVLLRRQMTEARAIEGRGRGRGRSRGGSGGGGGGGILRQAQASDELLSDLLRDERRKESSVILQCIRYIVKNSFLQPNNQHHHSDIQQPSEQGESKEDTLVTESQQLDVQQHVDLLDVDEKSRRTDSGGEEAGEPRAQHDKTHE